jgi:hypothetical protein
MTKKRLAANRRNALKSTGPTSPEGKARASMNALKHGLRSSSLAVPILENAEDWEAHRRFVLQDLAPVGYLERILAERIAAILWRLGRVVRYESAVVSNAINEVGKPSGVFGDFDEDTTPSADPKRAKEDAETLARVHLLKPSAHVDGEDAGTVLDLVTEALDLSEKEDVEAEVPEGHKGEHWGDWDGWTREALETAVQSLHKQAGDEYARVDPWEEALKEAKSAVILAQVSQEDHAARLDERRREALLPPDETLDKISRYETTLERSLFRILHELQRLRAVRSGAPALPPAAVDVDLAVHQEG